MWKRRRRRKSANRQSGGGDEKSKKRQNGNKYDALALRIGESHQRNDIEK